jgi:hypothetical protein
MAPAARPHSAFGEGVAAPMAPAALPHSAFGLTIRSAFPIFGALPLAGAPAVEPDVVIELGQARLDAAGEAAAATVEGPYALQGDQLLFTSAGCARYLCDGGRRIVIEPLAGSAPDEVAAMLIATALPALLWIRRSLVLHAACASPAGAGAAVAIAGASRGGKSTLLEQLVEAGWICVAENALRVELDGAATVRASGLPAALFRRPRRARRAGDEPIERSGDEPGERSESAGRPGEDGDPRALIPIPVAQCAATAPLRALFVLQPRLPHDGGAAICRLHGVAALTALLGQRYRPRVPRLLGHDGSVLAALARLIPRISVFAWQRREGDERLDAAERAALAEAACG